MTGDCGLAVHKSGSTSPIILLIFKGLSSYSLIISGFYYFTFACNARTRRKTQTTIKALHGHWARMQMCCWTQKKLKTATNIKSLSHSFHISIRADFYLYSTQTAQDKEQSFAILSQATTYFLFCIRYQLFTPWLCVKSSSLAFLDWKLDLIAFITWWLEGSMLSSQKLLHCTVQIATQSSMFSIPNANPISKSSLCRAMPCQAMNTFSFSSKHAHDTLGEAVVTNGWQKSLFNKYFLSKQFSRCFRGPLLWKLPGLHRSILHCNHQIGLHGF